MIADEAETARGEVHPVRWALEEARASACVLSAAERLNTLAARLETWLAEQEII